MNPLLSLLEVLSLGQAQVVAFGNIFSHDLYAFGYQMTSALNDGGNLLIASLAQVASQLPALPSLGSLGL